MEINYVSHDGLAEYTAFFKAFNNATYALKGDYALKSDLAIYATVNSVDNKLKGYATTESVDEIRDDLSGVQSSLGSYATKDEISGLASTSYVDSSVKAVDNKLGDYAKSTDLQGLASETYVDNKVKTVDDKLSGYAKSSDLNGLASETYVDGKVKTVDDKLSGYATKNDISGFQTASQVSSAIDSKTANLATAASVTSVRTDFEAADKTLQANIDKKQDKITAANAAEVWTTLGGGSVGKLNTNGSTSQYLRGNGTWAEIPTASPYAVGQEIVSNKTLNPSTLYGGTWELQSTHLFRGVYVYRRTA